VNDEDPLGKGLPREVEQCGGAAVGAEPGNRFDPFAGHLNLALPVFEVLRILCVARAGQGLDRYVGVRAGLVGGLQPPPDALLRLVPH